MTDNGPSAGRPEYSIVIPSRNRPEQLRKCLQALARLDTPKNRFEVIVVDDGSAEPYENWVSDWAPALSLRCIRRDGRGPGQARNAGVGAASGTFVALTDDDCEPAPDWLDQFAQVLRQRPDVMVGGRTVNVLSEVVCSEASQTLISYLYDYYSRSLSSNRFFASCNFALSANLYRQCGGFDSRFRLAGGEDRDLCDRWAAAGLAMVYVPEAVVHHSHRLTIRGFLRQHFTYGRGAWHLHRARAGRGGPPVVIEPPEFFLGMLAWPFKNGEIRRPATVTVLIGISLVLNIMGYAYERFAAGRSSA